MTKESTGKVLEGILEDADMAGQVAGGDFTSFGEEDLTDSERALLQAAAAEIDDEDVSGFYLKLGDIKGESRFIDKSSPDLLLPKLEIAANYAGLLSNKW